MGDSVRDTPVGFCGGDSADTAAYRQCVLERRGTETQIAWLPVAYAVPGLAVRIRPVEETWHVRRAYDQVVPGWWLDASRGSPS